MVPVDRDQMITKRALQTFLNEGVQPVTMKSLAELLGVSTKTIYKLYQDKTQLLESCLHYHYQQLMVELSGIIRDSKDEIEGILRVMDRIIELEFETNPRFYRDLNKFYPELQSDVISAHMEHDKLKRDLIKDGKSNGLFRKEIRPVIFWTTFTNLYAGITRADLYRDLDHPVSDILNNSILVYFRGICTPLGLSRLDECLNSNFLKNISI